jgi:membrane protein insertase Oxa1/YidC/SpoIIIJ
MVIPGGDIPLLGFLIGAVNGMLGGGIRSLNILPLFMAVGMYLQQHMMPKTTAGPQAAQQKHMMIFMTVFFALILYNAPAGLNLYIFTSTMLGFIEQKYIRHRLEQMSNVPTVGGTAPSAQSKKVELGSGRFRSPAERLQAWLSKRVGAKRGAEQGRGDGKKREK